MMRFRLQFLGSPTDCGLVVLEEREIRVVDQAAAVREAADALWPVRARAYRLVDLDGRELDWKAKGDS
jgi:hypothetical protein